VTTDNLQTLAAWLNEAPGRYVVMRGGKTAEQAPDGEYRWSPDRTTVQFTVRDGQHGVETAVPVELCCDIMAGDLSATIVRETKTAIECLVFSTKKQGRKS
jgi:hypothetical protein